MNKPLWILLDVDGVLADEDGQLARLTAPEKVRPVTDLGYFMREPLVRSNSKFVAAKLVEDMNITIVSKRPTWAREMTITWLNQFYPWLMPQVRGVKCIGPGAQKLGVRGPYPDFVIDDSLTVIQEAVDKHVPVIAVRSSRCEALAAAWMPNEVHRPLHPETLDDVVLVGNVVEALERARKLVTDGHA